MSGPADLDLGKKKKFSNVLSSIYKLQFCGEGTKMKRVPMYKHAFTDTVMLQQH